MKHQEWTQQQLDAAAALADEIMQSAPAGQTVEQHMKDALAMRVEGIDAGQQVAALCAGIDLFYKTLERAEKQDLSVLVSEELDRLAAGQDAPAQAAQLHDILSACARATGQPEPETADPDQIPAMREAICEYFSQYALLCTTNPALVELVQAIGTDRLEVLQKAEAQVLDERYLALALYIQKATGQLDGIPADLTAKEIGVSAASALCTGRTLRDGLLGKIDASTMKARLKLIAGVTLLALLIAVAAKLALAVGVLTFFFVETIVGLGLIGTIAAIALGLVTGGSVVQSAARLAASVAAATGVDKLVDTAVSKLSNWYHLTLQPAAQAFWERVRALLRRSAEAETDTQTTSAQQADEAAAPAKA